MSRENRIAIAQAITATAEYYGKQLSKTTLSMMVDDLGDYPAEEVGRALKQHRADPDQGRFFPLTGALIAYLGGSPEDRARNAWGVAVETIRRHGMYKSIAFVEDPLIGHTIAGMGGWALLCQTPVNEMQWRQKEFVDRYAANTRTPPANMPDVLPGIGGDGQIAYVGTPPANTLPKPPQRSDGAAIAYLSERIAMGVDVDQIKAK